MAQLREASNKVVIKGILKEVDLKEENDVIRGVVIIQTGDNESHTISVYAARFTKSGAENKAYRGLQTVMNSYVSLASLLDRGYSREEALSRADKISMTNGRLGRNEFYSNGELVSRPQISCNHFTRIDATAEKFVPKATFEVECFFTKIKNELKDDEPTGALLIDTYIPQYGGRIIPMRFIAKDPQVVDYLSDNYEENKSGKIWGNIVNQVITSTTKQQGFGSTIEDTRTNFIREFVVTGGLESQYSEEKEYPPKDIREAITVRETEILPALLEKSQQPKSGFKPQSHNVPASAISHSDLPEFLY